VAEVKEVTVPDIGDFEDVPIIEILVSAGDEVDEEAPLVTLESDKATMDVPAPFAGKVAELLVEVGDTVSEGSAILKIETSSNGATPAEEDEDEDEDDEGGEEEAGSGENGGAEEEPASEAAREEPAAEGSAEPAGEADSDGAPPYASPAVRRLARERGIDLAGISGSGRKGRITKEDVEQAESGGAKDRGGAAAPAGGDAAGSELGLAPWPQVDFEKFGDVERVQLSRIKRISGPNLARNWVRIPHVTHHEDADVTDLEAFRKQLNGEQSDVKVTMVALLVKASVASLKAFPNVNASLDGDELVLRKYWNIGFAADTPNGLVVPVIKGADAKGILEIAGELTELSGKAREGKLGPADMQGATFTISSLGGIGGTGFTPIINAPEVAILGATRTQTKPVWDGAEFRPRLILPLSLSYDHRVIDGAEAARFCAHLAGVVSDMRRVLL
jgi:pyruvate dehydrogenase E2 component (dihydrolipoamide acetyltransferase)